MSYAAGLSAGYLTFDPLWEVVLPKGLFYKGDIYTDEVNTMKNIVLPLALLVPGAVFAVPCDMTRFKEIDQRYIVVAPACIDSGDYASAACADVNDLKLEMFQASASIKALRCEDLPYEEDPRLAPLRNQVLALEQAQVEKERLARKPKELPAPEVSSPKYDNGAEACTQLIKDIEQKYDFSELKWLRNKGDMSAFYPIMPCAYEAIRATVYGDTPVIIEATLNLSSHRYRLKVR